MARLSSLGAFSVLHNNILGPGVLGLPWAVAQGGLGLGMALLVLSACTGFAGMQFLGSSAVHVLKQLPAGERLTLANACALADARELRLAMEVGLVLSCSGALVTSLIIVGDSLAPLGGATREQWIAGVFLAVPFPLSFFSQISFLRFSSYLSFLMMIYLAALMMARTLDGSTCPVTAEMQLFRLDNLRAVFQTIPVFTFCFCGHMSIFPFVAELDNVSTRRVNLVILFATLSATFIFSMVAASAVVCFGNATPQDLLNKYSSTTTVVAARIGMTIVCCSFYPLLVQPVRSTVLGWLKLILVAGMKRTHSDDALLSMAADVRRGYDKAVTHTLDLAYKVVTAAIAASCLAIALMTSSLGVVFSLSGATGFALLCNVCPPWLYLAVSPKEEDRWMRAAAWGLLAYGLFMIPVCISANFAAAFNEQAGGVLPQCILPASCDVDAFCRSVGV